MNGIIVRSFGSPDVLEYSELPVPSAQESDIIIDVRAASINNADVQARSGRYHLGKELPYTPGIDLAGIVAGVGRNVKTIKKGDHVIAFPSTGSYAEQAVAPEHLSFVIPKQISFKAAAAAAIVAGTVTHMLTEIASIRPGENILIHGASGGVGTTAIQIARFCKAGRIIGSVGSLKKSTYLERLGADATVDYRDSDYPGTINQLTAEAGVDVILNPIGGKTVERDLQCLAPFGRLISFGRLSESSGSVSPELLYTTNRSIIGFSFGHFRKQRPAMISSTMKRVIEILASGQLQMVVDSCFPLDQAARAHQRVESREVFGKVLLFPIEQYNQMNQMTGTER